MRRLAIPVLLGVAGAVLIYVGVGTLFLPHAFFASNGATLDTAPSLMSEVRAPGGLLLASGVLVALGAFRPGLAELALKLTALVYGAFGVARVISVVFDGVPSHALVTAAAFELFIGAVALLALMQFRPRQA